MTTPLTFAQVRAALQSPSKYRHALASKDAETANVFDGLKSGIQHNRHALAALEGCPVRGERCVRVIDGIECSAVIDAMGEVAILRCITTPKESPSADLKTFTNLVQKWHLDLQMEFEKAVAFPDAWYAWVVIECNAPYDTAIYSATAGLIVSGKEKLKRAFDNIRLANLPKLPSTYPEIESVPVPEWREKELAQ